MSDNVSIMKRKFTQMDLDKIDPRLQGYINGWQLVEEYKGKTVRIPSDWNSEIYPYKYFEVYKTSNDPNAGESENEIQLYLAGGWRGYDDEVVIVVMILGYDVLGEDDKISAEIYKFGGAPMKLYHNNKLITDFKKQTYWWKEPQDKVWIERLD